MLSANTDVTQQFPVRCKNRALIMTAGFGQELLFFV